MYEIIIKSSDFKTNNNMTEDIKSLRKVYSRIHLLDLFYCPIEVPSYLLAFPELLKEEVDYLWCKKPLPKFEEVVEGHRPKSSVASNKFKGRQRSFSNQFGDSVNEEESNIKYKHQTLKSKTDKFNRYNILNESYVNTSINKEIVEDIDEDNWQTIESKSSKLSNLSKHYVFNQQVQENHWKKWGKDRTVSGEKAGLSFSKTEKTNNFVVRKANYGNKVESKMHASHSFSAGTDQTEDIWQDDWETEMQSRIGIEPLEFYERSPSSFIENINMVEPHEGVNASCDDMPMHEVDSNLWFYKDLSSQIQGPFSSENMANWLATGYFDYSTTLRRKCDEKFLLLAEYRVLYGRIPFTKGPTISPILCGTTINIDPNQLIVGVDKSILQKVLINATSLSSTRTSFINTENIMNSDINEADKQSIIEEKRKLEEFKAELERERKKLLDEQEQWKIRMQTFREQQINEESQISSEVIMPVNMLGINQEKKSIYKSESSELNIKDELIHDPEVMVDKKNKNIKSSHTIEKNIQQTIQLSLKEIEIAHVENVPNVLKGVEDFNKVSRSTTDEFKVTNPNNSLCNIKLPVVNVEPSKISKSLLEIQAEEIQKEKMKQGSEKMIDGTKAKDNKITSFKDSLLKNVAVMKTSPMSGGKSIWDVTKPTDFIIPLETVAKPVERKIVKKTLKKSSDNNTNYDELLNWCKLQLSKFRNDLDANTVMELLKEVPNESVLELILELLDDSIFSRNFAKDFIQRRADLKMPLQNVEDAWQTVKKSQGGTPIDKKTSSTSRKPRKKKMLVVDHIKSVS